MLRIVKLVLYSWFIKYWFVVILALIIGGTGAIIQYSIEKKTKRYSANTVGCTLLLNHHAFIYYLYPFVENIHKGNYKEAAFFMGMEEREIQNIKDLHLSSVTEIAEESDVRYEFSIIIQLKNDTTGLSKFENALYRLIKNHVLLLDFKENNERAYVESKKIMDRELIRLDSILLTLNKSNFSDREMIYKRKSEIEIQLINFKASRMKIYDVKLINGFKYSLVEEKVEIKEYLISWLGIFLFVSFTLVVFLDKEIRALFL